MCKVNLEDKIFGSPIDESEVFFSLNGQDLDFVIKECLTEEEKDKLFRHYSREDILHDLLFKLNIEWIEAIEDHLKYKILRDLGDDY